VTTYEAWRNVRGSRSRKGKTGATAEAARAEAGAEAAAAAAGAAAAAEAEAGAGAGADVDLGELHTWGPAEEFLASYCGRHPKVAMPQASSLMKVASGGCF
jgi:hypothetical protein